MRTFTKAELRAQLERDDWAHEDIIETGSLDSFTVEKMCDNGADDWVPLEVGVTTFDVFRRSTLDDMTVDYWTSVRYEDFEPETFKTDNSWYNCAVCNTDGFTVVDEDGDGIDELELDAIIQEYDKFTDFDFSQTFEEMNKAVQIDVDEELEMKTTTIEVTNEPNIEFMGEELAKVNNMINRNGGDAIRYSRLALYQTQAGRFICHQCDVDRMGGETYYYTATVADDHAGVIGFFGHGDLAKELYSEAGIEDKITVQ